MHQTSSPIPWKTTSIIWNLFLRQFEQTHANSKDCFWILPFTWQGCNDVCKSYGTVCHCLKEWCHSWPRRPHVEEEHWVTVAPAKKKFLSFNHFSSDAWNIWDERKKIINAKKSLLTVWKISQIRPEIFEMKEI